MTRRREWRESSVQHGKLSIIVNNRKRINSLLGTHVQQSQIALSATMIASGRISTSTSRIGRDSNWGHEEHSPYKHNTVRATALDPRLLFDSNLHGSERYPKIPKDRSRLLICLKSLDLIGVARCTTHDTVDEG